MSDFPANIEVSDEAFSRIKELIDESEDVNYLRVSIVGGGCSGLSYQFSFDNEKTEEDYTVSKDNVVILVDMISYPYLDGAKINYIKKEMSEMFTVDNPNAETTCGCGSSFSA